MCIAYVCAVCKIVMWPMAMYARVFVCVLYVCAMNDARTRATMLPQSAMWTVCTYDTVSLRYILMIGNVGMNMITDIAYILCTTIR
jgi:hypothetical protein